MRHKLLPILLTVLCALPLCTSARKISTLAADAVLRAKPDNRAPVVCTVPAGEVVTVLEAGLPDFWVKVQGPDGSIGYTDSGALDSPAGWETDETAAAPAGSPAPAAQTGDAGRTGQSGEIGQTGPSGQAGPASSAAAETIDGIPVRRDEAGNLLCAVVRTTPVHSRRESTGTGGTTFSPGTLLSVAEVDRAAGRAAVLLNGNTVYVDLKDVGFDSRRFPQAETVAAAPIPQRAVPRDGAYRVAHGGMRVYGGKPSSHDVREGVFAEGEVVRAEYINDEWLAIPSGEAETVYVQRKYLRKLKLYELVREFGEESPIVEAERELIDRAPAFTLFNGWRAGLYGVWLILAAAAAAAVAIWRIFKNGECPAPRTIVRFGLLLALLSLLEIWYFLSLGTDDAAWFLGRRGGEYAWINFFLMLAVTAVQGFGIFKYAESVQERRCFTFSHGWLFGGIVIALILYGLWLLTKMNDEIPSRSVAPVLVVCALAGQIPQVLAILVGFLRRKWRVAGSPSIAGVLATYWIALIGLICLGALSIGLLIAMAFGALFVYKLMRDMPRMAYEGATDVLNGNANNSRYGAAMNRLEHQVRTGTMDPQRAQEIRDKLQGMLDNGENIPEKLDF